MTTVAAIVAKYGIKKAFETFAGDQGVGDLAAELFGAWVARQDRLEQRLAVMEPRFGEVLDQPYSIALGTGLRTMSDADATATVQEREDELLRARDLFREASTAARSSLQIAVAERYVVLCALALDRPTSAQNALRRLEHHALTALLEAGDRSEFDARRATAELQAKQELGPAAKPSKLHARIRDLVPPIQEADVAVNSIAGRLLQEAAVFAEGFGIAPAPELRWVPPLESPAWAESPGSSVDPMPRTLLDIGQWEIRPSGPGPIRVGPLSVVWHHRVHEVLPYADTGYRAELFTAGAGASAYSTLSAERMEHQIDVGVTVRVDRSLSRSPRVLLNGGYTTRELLGQTEAHLTCSLWPDWAFTVLKVDDVLRFPFGTGPDLT